MSMFSFYRPAWAALGIVTAATLFSPVLAQDSRPQNYRVAVEAAVYDLYVRDGQGLPVRGLASHDFLIYQGGQPCRILTVQEMSAHPVAVAVLLDTGPSMSVERLRQAKKLIFELIHTLDPSDQILLGVYDREVHFLSSLTNERPPLLRGLENLAPARTSGRLSLRQAFAHLPGNPAAAEVAFTTGSSRTGLAVDLAGLELQKTALEEKIVVVISSAFSDVGQATADHLIANRVRLVAVGPGGILESLLASADPEVRPRTRRVSGGVGLDLTWVTEQVERLRDTLKHHYLVAYEPPPDGAALDPTFSLPGRLGLELTAVPARSSGRSID